MRSVVIATIWCVLSGIGSADDAIPDFAYLPRMVGVADRDLRAALQQNALTFTLQSRPPASEIQLRRRVDADLPYLRGVLESRGYYGHSVDVDLDSGQVPAVVTFDIRTGPQYTLASIDVELIDVADDPTDVRPPRSSLKPGHPATVPDILAEEKRMVRVMRQRGFPFAEVVRRRTDIDHDRHTLTVHLGISPGPRARFGGVDVEGLDTVRESFVLKRLTWEPGDTYDERQGDRLESRLLHSGLFSEARVERAPALEPDGSLRLRVHVAERKHRTIRLGVGYRTDIGVGTRVFWEHRNVFRRGNRLRTSGTYSRIELSNETTFEISDFLRPEQSLVFGYRVGDDDPDAYFSRSAQFVVTLVMPIMATNYTLSVGAADKYSEVTQLGETDHFNLLFFPAVFEWDARNDRLDPQTGTQFVLGLTPFQDTNEADLQFVRGIIGGSGFIRIPWWRSIVVALRANAGVIEGARRRQIPADERFYSGGGGSVRGYEYQAVGQQIDGTPIGGKSLLEVSTELRMRHTESIGSVVFVDGGMVFAESVPSSDEELQWGAGLGFRYFTGIGPFRFDIAVPVNKRKGIDEDFQFYISLGQAF